MMCLVYKLNKQGDNREPFCTPFSILSWSVVPYRVLTVASWHTYRFLRRQVRWSGILISLKAFHNLLWLTHTVKGFRLVNETEVDVFLKFPCFLYDSADVGNLISGSSAFSKPTLDVWKFLAQVMLKPGMQDFKHDFNSIGDECNCLMVCIFFSTALLGNWITRQWPMKRIYIYTYIYIYIYIP